MSLQIKSMIDVKTNYIVDHLYNKNDGPLNVERTLRKMSLTPARMMDSNDDIRIEMVEEKDTQEILNLLKNYFFQDEPMNTYLQLGECKELEDYSRKSLPDKCSIKAVNSNGEIIGVYVNGIVRKPALDEEPAKYADACQHEKFRKILKLFEYIDDQFNVFDLYPDIDCYLDGRILSVNPNYRGLGLAARLTEKSLEYAKINKIPLMSVLCSSYVSARVCEKLGFKLVYTLKYCDYFVDGKNPILPAEPHTAVQILVKEIV